jgi:hypothetical protein
MALTVRIKTCRGTIRYRLIALCSEYATSSFVLSMKNVLPKRRFIINPHGALSQQTAFFIVTAVKTSKYIRCCCNCIVKTIAMLPGPRRPYRGVQRYKRNPWPEFASELYRSSDRRLWAKLVPTFTDRGCHVGSVTDPYDRNLGFLYRSRYFFFQVAPQLYSRG